MTQPFDTPGLPDHDTSLAPQDLYSRSFTGGKSHFMRAIVGSKLPLILSLYDETELSARLYTNLNTASWDEWQFVEPTAISSEEIRFDLQVEKRGSYSCRLQVSLDGGETWLWDSAAETYILAEPAGLRHLKMYTLIPQASGSIMDWIRLLPEIAGMDFNMIHLLPITHMDQSQSPYSAYDFFAIDPRYRDESVPRSADEQFEEFVQAMESHGLRLCVDLVYNHTGVTSMVAKRRPEWIMGDAMENDGMRRAGWQGDVWHKWLDLVLIHYDHPVKSIRDEIWDYMRAYCHKWGGYAARTGGMIRLDNLHSSHEGFTQSVLADLRETYPELLIFAELFTDHSQNARLIWKYGLNTLLGTPWELHFVPELRNYLKYVHACSPSIRFFTPVSTHDSGTPAQEFGDVRSTLPRYAISCFFTQGLTGMSQGVEYGCKRKINFIGENCPIELTNGIEFTKEIAKFHRILDEHPIFHDGGNLTFIDDEHHAIMAAWRMAPEEMQNGILAMVNLDIMGKQTIDLKLGRHGLLLKGKALEDMLTGRTVPVTGDVLKLTLYPCDVRIYRVIDNPDATVGDQDD